jgi:hypothetical protein
MNGPGATDGGGGGGGGGGGDCGGGGGGGGGNGGGGHGEGGHSEGDDGAASGASQGRRSGVWGSSSAETARSAVSSGEARSLGEVLAVIAKRTPDKVLEVDLNRAPLGWQYDLLILDASRRYLTVTVDARNLRVLAIRRR